jgi:peptidoglycan/LPS O-acetylase OafA/YrhL
MRVVESLVSRFRRVTSSGTYVPQIDGLRFIAIIIVLVFHSGLKAFTHVPPDSSATQWLSAHQPNGSAGVELFFFISGMIISFPFLNHHPPTIQKFYLRRLYRLEPPYVLTLLMCYIALDVAKIKPHGAIQFEQQSVPLGASFFASLVYLHGTIFGTAPRLNPPLWSLEIEVVFYLLAPALLAVYLRLRRPRTRLLIAFSAVLLSIILQVFLVEQDTSWYFRFPSHMYGFFLGVAVGDWVSQVDQFYSRRGPVYDVIWILALTGLLFTACFQSESMSSIWHGGLLILRAASIVGLFIGSAWGPVGSRITGSLPLSLVGGACYSLYLVHVPVITACAGPLFKIVRPNDSIIAWIVGVTVLTAASAFVGLIFFIFVERPCMNPQWPSSLGRRIRGFWVTGVR